MLLGIKEFMVDTGEVRENCISFGRGDAPLILISGLNLRDVRGTAAALGLAWAYRCFARDYRVYVFDRREDLPEKYTVEEIAGDIAAGMTWLGVQNADVFGVSQGGMIAQYLAIDHPELVRKLVLGVTLSRPNPVIERNIDAWCEMVRRGDMKSILTDYFSRTYSERYLRKNAALLPFLIRTMKTMAPERFLTLAEACLSCHTYELLERIRCPVLVLGGKQDRIASPEASLEIAEKLGCEICMYEDYGHSAYEEAKDFNRRVLGFLAR